MLSNPSQTVTPPPPSIPDFSSLGSKFDELANSGDAADEDILLRALKAGEPLGNLKASLDEEAKLLRQAVLADFSAKSADLVELDRKAKEADAALRRMEKQLDDFQSHLR
ncbi:Vacuolar protein sorting-associated protein 52 [Perkinsus chesapeaki]|uniref:Vacuolar protein sorting-associated protein 52 n=1 Tax=Perkinsus chesapeaki TaxID=330153 RepID=A0A7J6MJC1_PERCH|nr:Vacuolar protein sorting-associated protein 52 [Perkinsus chesapeaki]